MSISVSEGLDIPVSEGLESSTRGSCRSNESHVRNNSNASYRKLSAQLQHLQIYQKLNFKFHWISSTVAT